MIVRGLLLTKKVAYYKKNKIDIHFFMGVFNPGLFDLVSCFSFDRGTNKTERRPFNMDLVLDKIRGVSFLNILIFGQKSLQSANPESTR